MRAVICMGGWVSAKSAGQHTRTALQHMTLVWWESKEPFRMHRQSNDILRILFLITEVHGKVCIVH